MRTPTAAFPSEKRRAAATSLANLERDGSPGIVQNEPVRHFHIEFGRGAYQLFGPTRAADAPDARLSAAAAAGPVWFQRMDRNNDGDLIWNEFLGPAGCSISSTPTATSCSIR